MSDNKEQSVAALNTLINLALQVANTQQAQVQNAAKVLFARAFGVPSHYFKTQKGDGNCQNEHWPMTSWWVGF